MACRLLNRTINRFALIAVTVALNVSVRLAAGAIPSTTPLGDTAWAGISPHPRLFASAARFDQLRQGVVSDEVSKDLFQLVCREADRALAAKPIEYVDGPEFLLPSMREVQSRILSCAMVYRLTGDKRYFVAARRELLALAALTDWGHRHFLDIGEAALACGTGLDWLYDDLTADDRDRLTHAIVENALLPSLKQTAGGDSWVTGDFNWNPVCHGSLATAALSIAEREPALARQVVDRAVASVPYAGATYAPDGAFPEGPSYWAYGTTFYVLLAEALRSSFHTDCGLLAAPGFLNSADYLKQVVGPTGEDFNYADYHTRRPPTPVLLWYARELRRRDIADTELAGIRSLVALDPTATLPQADGRRHLPMELLWWDPTLPPARSEPTRKWIAGGAAPLAIFRTAWNDPKAAFIAMKGGTPNGSHAHMDVGGFILEADGVRWAVDLGTEDYVRMHDAKIDIWHYAQDGNRWSVFRNGPEGHNILRFDDDRQTVGGFAEIKPLPDGPDGTWSAEADLSPLYTGKARQVSRDIQLSPDRSVIIDDRWTAATAAVAVQWQWLTLAEVTPKPGGAILRQSGQSLDLQIVEPAGAVVQVQDVSRPRGPQDSPNPGLRRIVIRLSTKGNENGRLVVRAVPGGPAH